MEPEMPGSSKGKKNDMKKESLRRYLKKCRNRSVMFYICDADIYSFSKTIDFSAFVKKSLRDAMTEKKD